MQGMTSADFQSDGRNHNYFSVLSDLVSLTAHIRASIEMLELAIATESLSGNLESYDNTVVLDDITPRYLSANAALHGCQAKLAVALHCLQDADATDRFSGHDGISARRA